MMTMVKTILNLEETVDMPLEKIHEQYLKPQMTEPFLYNGKKYALLKYEMRHGISEDEPHAEVFLKEIT